MRTELKEKTLIFVTGGYYLATVTGTKHYLAIRSEPDYYNSIELAELHNGTHVTVLSAPSDSWYWIVKGPDGTIGYVNKRFLK